ncbi:signal peptidase I [Alkalicoccus luteus]|uniref:signal peptidase I n=1 Tax=Alkalicoccus luteus TaxID=1237094 RepID=UPI004033B8DE
MKQIGSWMVTAGILAAVILAWPFYILNDDRSNLSLFGYQTLTVLSNSMEPEFTTQDMIIIGEQQHYAEGDIITVNTGSELVTHRIVEAVPDGFHTMGDANATVDSTLAEPGMIEGGHVLTIPYAGFVVHFITSLPGFLLLIVLPVTAVVTMSLMKRFSRSAKKDDNPEGASST